MEPLVDDAGAREPQRGKGVFPTKVAFLSHVEEETVQGAAGVMGGGAEGDEEVGDGEGGQRQGEPRPVKIRQKEQPALRPGADGRGWRRCR